VAVPAAGGGAVAGELCAAEALKDAEVAETTYSPSGWEHEPLRLIVGSVR